LRAGGKWRRGRRLVLDGQRSHIYEDRALVDVAGGRGAPLEEILAAYPGAEGVQVRFLPGASPVLEPFLALSLGLWA
jgi:hypothetical protein